MNDNNSNKELAGIIGGIGPEAGIYFATLLIKLRMPSVTIDQDHIPFILYNNPQVPDRTAYLLKQNDISPLPELVRTGKALKEAGATFLAIPCNTAHAFVSEIEKEVGLPVINMIDETTSYIAKKYGENVPVGLLATTGTLQSKLYQQSFQETIHNSAVLIPDEEEQSKVMQAIYSIKSSSVTEENFTVLNTAATNLIKKGATAIVLGCTEIPLALTAEKCTFERIDPMEILAQKVVERTLS